MATTVFPQTDDVVTVAAWQSLNSTIDRGADTFYDTFGSPSDTNLVKFEERVLGSVTTSDVDIEKVCELSLDAGHTYYVRGCLSMQKLNEDTTDDNCFVGISLGAGMSMSGFVTRGNQIASGSVGHTLYTIESGSGNYLLFTIDGTDGVAFAEEPALWVDLIVVANQDADISFYYVKQADVYSTWYRSDELTYLIATPIRG